MMHQYTKGLSRWFFYG